MLKLGYPLYGEFWDAKENIMNEWMNKSHKKIVYLFNDV